MKMQVVNIVQQLSHRHAGEFIDILPFNDGALGAVNITGESPFWEMHPDTDELFYVVEGCLHLELLNEQGSEQHRARSGETMVVPKSYWHKLSAPSGAKFIYLTPGQSLHSDEDDPRYTSH